MKIATIVRDRSWRGVLLRLPILFALMTFGAWLMGTTLMNALLFYPRAAIEATPADGGLRYEDLSLATADGERLQAWWIPTTRKPALGHVLFFHGNAGNISHRVVDAQLLVAEGFDVFLFDYRGYGQSTGKPSEEGTYKDARAALTALRARPEVDQARIFYHGESLGGAVAIELSLVEPPAGLILRSAFSSIKDIARLHYPIIPAFVVPDAYPSVRRIREVDCPVLVIHGDRDEVAPLAHGKALFEAAPGSKRIEILGGVGHNDLMALQGLRQARVIGEWAAGLSRR